MRCDCTGDGPHKNDCDLQRENDELKRELEGLIEEDTELRLQGIALRENIEDYERDMPEAWELRAFLDLLERFETYSDITWKDLPEYAKVTTWLETRATPRVVLGKEE